MPVGTMLPVERGEVVEDGCQSAAWLAHRVPFGNAGDVVLAHRSQVRADLAALDAAVVAGQRGGRDRLDLVQGGVQVRPGREDAHHPVAVEHGVAVVAVQHRGAAGRVMNTSELNSVRVAWSKASMLSHWCT